jgi:hypothetical protein
MILLAIMLVLTYQKMRTRGTWAKRSSEQFPLVAQGYMIHANHRG